MTIPLAYRISDPRLVRDFGKVSISNYRKNEVIKAFMNSMINSKLEEACSWMVELHATGCLKNIESELFKVYTNYIHIKNPALLFYLSKRTKYLNNLLKDYKKDRIIFSRNCQEIRNLLVELTAICTLSKKTNLFTGKMLPKIKEINYNSSFIRNKLTSLSIEYILPYLSQNDPGEIKLALNEIANLLQLNEGFQKVIYWYLWLKKLTKSKEKNDEIFKCTKLELKEIPVELGGDWEFYLWQIILNRVAILDNMVKKFVRKLYECYTDGIRKSNKTIKEKYIFIAVYVLTEQTTWTVPMIPNQIYIIQACCNINLLYAKIEKNLVSKYNPQQQRARQIKFEEVKNSLSEKEENSHSRAMSIKSEKDLPNEVLIQKAERKLSLFTDLICYKKDKTPLDYYRMENQNNEKKVITLKK